MAFILPFFQWDLSKYIWYFIFSSLIRQKPHKILKWINICWNPQFHFRTNFKPLKSIRMRYNRCSFSRFIHRKHKIAFEWDEKRHSSEWAIKVHFEEKMMRLRTLHKLLLIMSTNKCCAVNIFSLSKLKIFVLLCGIFFFMWSWSSFKWIFINKWNTNRTQK